MLVYLGIVMLVLVSSLFFIYERYVPVIGIKRIDVPNDNLRENMILLDVRDYHIASKKPIHGETIHLPLAYLKRYYQDVRGKEIVIVASDLLLVNLSARFLRRKGIKVIGYYTYDDQKKIAPSSCDNSCVVK